MEWIWAAGGFAAGLGVTVLRLLGRGGGSVDDSSHIPSRVRDLASEPDGLPEAQATSDAAPLATRLEEEAGPSVDVHSSILAPTSEIPLAATCAPEPEEPVAPHLLGLISQALREPLRLLRRDDPPIDDAIEKLERLSWQMRMLVSRPRPMQGKTTAAMTLLQEAAQEVPALAEGRVAASWSLLCREPIYGDPERIRGAFRELLAAGAAVVGTGGRLGIKITEGRTRGFPVQIDIEIGRRGTETDSLSLRVARHLIESQGGRVEVDGNITRVLLRNAAADEIASVA
jgi:hypothetical protein